MISKKHLLSTVAVVPMTVGVALGLTSVEAYQEWCTRHGFSTRIAKHWHQRCKRHVEGKLEEITDYWGA